MMFSESILFFLEMEKDDLPPVDEDIVDEGGGLQVACFYCTARQCLRLRRKFTECSINTPALSLLMKHLVIGQSQKPPNFSAFHWSPHGNLVSIGQNFECSTFTKKD